MPRRETAIVAVAARMALIVLTPSAAGTSWALTVYAVCGTTA